MQLMWFKYSNELFNINLMLIRLNLILNMLRSKTQKTVQNQIQK